MLSLFTFGTFSRGISPKVPRTVCCPHIYAGVMTSLKTFRPSMVIQPGLFLSIHSPRELKNPLRFFPGEIWATPAVMHCREEHRVRAQRGVLCSGRELCRGLAVLHRTGTKDERKGSDVINLPFLTLAGFQKKNKRMQSNTVMCLLLHCPLCSPNHWHNHIFILLCADTPGHKSELYLNKGSQSFLYI